MTAGRASIELGSEGGSPLKAQAGLSSMAAEKTRKRSRRRRRGREGRGEAGRSSRTLRRAKSRATCQAPPPPVAAAAAAAAAARPSAPAEGAKLSATKREGASHPERREGQKPYHMPSPPSSRSLPPREAAATAAAAATGRGGNQGLDRLDSLRL